MKQITCPHCGDTYPDFDVAHVCSKGPYSPKLKPKMNERIRELARQSTGASTIYMLEEEWTKFAELIVRECDRYARSSWEHGPLLGKDLLIHFGIEEPDDGDIKS